MLKCLSGVDVIVKVCVFVGINICKMDVDYVFLAFDEIIEIVDVDVFFKVFVGGVVVFIVV